MKYLKSIWQITAVFYFLLAMARCGVTDQDETTGFNNPPPKADYNDNEPLQEEIREVDQTKPTDQLDTWEVILIEESLDSLAKYLDSERLMDSLKLGTYTIFAPSNEAFAQKNQATDSLRNATPGIKKGILNFHLVKGEITSKDLEKYPTISTEQGQELKFSGQDKIQINQKAFIVQKDIRTKSGIIHIIDQVLMPDI